MPGWIKIYREISEHWLWCDPVKFKWWVDMLLMVNYEPSKVLIGQTLIPCERGQMIRSLDTLARRWMVTKKTVKTFLLLLQSDDMIRIENVKISTRITICNYEKYQEQVHDKETASTRQVNDTYTHKRSKEVKKDKNNIIEDFDFSIFNEIEIPLKRWLDYKKGRKESYKTIDSLTELAEYLQQLSGNDCTTAEKIISRSMANNWAGLFPLKDDNKGTINGKSSSDYRVSIGVQNYTETP